MEKMARLSVSSARLAPTSPQTDPLTDLSRLLSRLQQTVLRADAERERRLRTSEFERKKVGTNIDHARTLLTKLEQEALATKVHPRKHDLVTDLNRKRELLEQLTERLRDLEEIASQTPEDDDDNSSDGEDILAEIIATPSESMDSRSTDIQETPDQEDEPEQEEAPQPEIPSAHTIMPSPAPSPQSQQETTTSSTLRSRAPHPAPSPPPDTAQTTSALLLGTNRPATSAHLTTTEAILDHQRREQDTLSESILKIASDLKASSLSFSETLEEDKEVVAKAGQGLDKNERGLEAAARRMGMLRRVSEGKGWWGRIMLYAWIYGLMGVLVVLVFGGPKLRF